MSKKYDFSDFDAPKSAQYDFSDFEGSAPVSELESFGRGALQGATLGYSDEIIGGIESLLTDKSYEQARNESRQANKIAQSQNPYSYGTGEFGAGVATAFVPGLNTAKLGTIGARVAANAGLGALAGAGMSEGENALEIVKDATIGGTLGGGLTYGIEKAMPYVQKGAKFVGDKAAQLGNKALNTVDDSLLPKLGKTIANIPEDMTSEYLAKKGNLEARNTEEIMDELVGYYNNASSKLDDSKFGFENAKSALDEAKSMARNQLVDEKFNTQNLLSEARESLQNKVMTEKEALKNYSVQNLRDTVSESIDALKAKVSSGSGQAFDALEKIRGKFKIYEPLRELEAGIADLTIAGKPISDSANSSFNNLMALKERLEPLAKTGITSTQAKQILQQLDDDIKLSASKGSFSPEADIIKARFRRSLDNIIKSISPEYKAIMQEVADDTQLLTELSSGFGSETKLLNRLNQLSSEKGRSIDLPLLKKLAAKTGQNWDETLDKYLQKQDLVNSPTDFSKYVDNFEEAKNLRGLQDYYNKLRDPNNVRSIDELQAVQKATLGLTDAEKALEAAKQDYKLFSNVKPGVIENKLKAMNGGRQYGANDIFEQINQKTGKNYTEEIRNRAILDSFEKGDTAGSRKTLAGALIGGPIGGVLGFAGDKFAGQTFKAILDGRIAAPEAIAKIAPKLGKYAQPLMQAAQRGNNSLASTMFILQQTDPNFRKLMQDKDE